MAEKLTGTKDRLQFETADKQILTLTTDIPGNVLWLYHSSYTVRSAITTPAELLVRFSLWSTLRTLKILLLTITASDAVLLVVVDSVFDLVVYMCTSSIIFCV